jgi:hypothetical protein
MSHASALWALSLGLLLTQSHVSAQDGPDPVDSSASLSAGADEDIQLKGDKSAAEHGPGHAAGTYTGVAPGGTLAKDVSASITKTPATITWPGFQMRADGTSRVFIQSTTPLSTQPSAAPGKFMVNLPGAHVLGGTNRLPLETRYFNTPVTRVMLNTNREGAQLILEMRADVSPQLSTERGTSGYYFTYIELPKGNFVSAEKPRAALTVEGAPPPPAPHAHLHIRKSSSNPNDLTTYPDSNVAAQANAHAAVGGQQNDAETPPSIKAQTRASGQIKLGQ